MNFDSSSNVKKRRRFIFLEFNFAILKKKIEFWLFWNNQSING